MHFSEITFLVYDIRGAPNQLLKIEEKLLIS